MSDLELFRLNGARLRSRLVDGEPWFVTGDVCDILSIGRVVDAISDLDDDEKGADTIRTPSGDQQVSIINEAGLYSLILCSHKPEAKLFKRWVTHDVLPQIRATHIAQTLSEALRLAADEHDRANAAEAKVAELAPKAAAVDVLTEVAGALKMGAVANMFGIGRTQLFRILDAAS